MKKIYIKVGFKVVTIIACIVVFWWLCLLWCRMRFCLPAHSSYDRYSLSSKNYEPLAFHRNHFWCFPHLQRRIYTYLVCFCQHTLATIDIPFRARIMNRTHFIESISGGFPHLERRIYTYIFSFCQRTRTRLHSKAVYCWLNKMHELRIWRSVNTHGLLRLIVNRPFPSSLVPLFQSESKYKTILMKMTLICMKMKMQAELIFIRMVSHLDSFWNRGTIELGNGPFC